MKHSEISSFIWRVCDDVLRGLFKPYEYGNIILPFTVLRRLDCVLAPRKDEVIKLYEKYTSKKVDNPTPLILKKIGTTFCNHSRYDLERLRQDPGNVLKNLHNYLGGYSQNVLEVIENFQLDKPIERLDKNGRLFQFVEKFSGINLRPDQVSNHQMGQVFEELLRKFSEMSNETSGEHYTPRDVVRLLVSLLFSEDRQALQEGTGKIRSIFDPCCGTGGMLTIGKEWVQEHVNSEVELRLLGQEINPQTYSVCKSDMMIIGENPENIRLGSSLSDDQFAGERFDYMATNPPFGVSWKSEENFVRNERDKSSGRFSAGVPRVSDGSLLFLSHMISKMEDGRGGARIGIVFNGSPLFTGSSGSGESEIRKRIIENDWLECIVSLPDQLFFNTGISTYIWLLSNRKSEKRKGRVQLIDGSSLFEPMKKSLGNKRKAITPAGREKLLKIFENFKENELCKIYPNEFFGYTKVTIEQPVTENGAVVRDQQGNPKADPKKRDYERVPLSKDIEQYFEEEVKPHLPDAWMDATKNSEGYEINFTKYFYKYQPLRSLQAIGDDLLKLDKETEGLMKEILT